MCDLFSGEEKPIELGETSVCIETSQEGKVIGAKRNAQSGTVVPIIQRDQNLQQISPPYGSLSELENLQKSSIENIEKVLRAIGTLLTEKFNTLETSLQVNIESIEDLGATCAEAVSIIEDVMRKIDVFDVLQLGKLMSKVQ